VSSPTELVVTVILGSFTLTLCVVILLLWVYPPSRDVNAHYTRHGCFRCRAAAGRLLFVLRSVSDGSRVTPLVVSRSLCG